MKNAGIESYNYIIRHTVRSASITAATKAFVPLSNYGYG